MNITLHEAARLAHRSERQILRWLEAGRVLGAKPDIANKWLIDLDSLQQTAALDPALLADISAEHGLTLAALSARLDAIEEKITVLLTRLAPPSTPQRATTSKEVVGPLPSDTLPVDLISLRQLCEEHGIAFSTIKKAMDKGRLSGIYHGNWKKGKAIVRYAVTDEQARQIIARWGQAKEEA